MIDLGPFTPSGKKATIDPSSFRRTIAFRSSDASNLRLHLDLAFDHCDTSKHNVGRFDLMLNGLIDETDDHLIGGSPQLQHI